MANMNYCAILMIFDASGSMDVRQRRLMTDAMHEMLEIQARKLSGFITVDAAYFDDTCITVLEGEDPLLVDLNYEEFMCGGTDIPHAFKSAVGQFEQRLKAMPEDEQPGHVVVMFSSDGQGGRDNGQAQQLGERLRGEGWELAYLSATGAGDSYANRAADQMGILHENVLTFDLNAKGMSQAAAALGEFVTVTRGGGEAHLV